MSKLKDTSIFRHPSKTLSPWDTAIKDAEQMIADAKRQIAILRNAIRGFEILRDGGHPWPQREKTAEKKPSSILKGLLVLGQKTNFWVKSDF